LASSQAGESVPYITKFNIVISQLFDFYANSAVCTAGLEAIQTFIQEKHKVNYWNLAQSDGSVLNVVFKG